MAELIQFEEGGVLVAVREAADTIQPTGVADKAVRVLERSFATTFHSLATIADTFRATCEPLCARGLASAELEVAMQFTASGDLYIVEAEAQAALKATFTFVKTPG